MRIWQGLEMFEVPQPGGFIYPVLLYDEQGLMLVDTGYPKQEDLLISIIQDAGFKLENLSHILLTHHDFDHIGALRSLREKFPNIEVMAYEAEIPYIDGSVDALKIQDMERNINHLPENKKAFLVRMKSFFPLLTTKVDFPLHDNDVLDIAGGVEVIFTPGHTLGHICLYHRLSKTLIAGDALNLDNGLLVGPNLDYTHDMQSASASIKHLEDFDIERIITYHGGLFTHNVNESIKKLTR